LAPPGKILWANPCINPPLPLPEKILPTSMAIAPGVCNINDAQYRSVQTKKDGVPSKDVMFSKLNFRAKRHTWGAYRKVN